MSRFAVLFVLLSSAATAQTAPNVIGTWELVASENVPVEDALVFARLTITDDRIETVYVFLDPDDGELAARFEDGRYLVSDGQLVVRSNNRVAILDATREGTFLRVHEVESGSTLTLREADPAGALDPDLLGTWAGTRGDVPFEVTFRADGTAEVLDGDDRDTGRYVVAGAYLILGDDPARYTLRRDAEDRRQLVVEADREQTVLQRRDR
ncbi:MAG: hypothetical protein AAGK21_00355 [Bacteroidota bacterium]